MTSCAATVADTTASLSGAIRVGGCVVLFDGGRCIAGPAELDVLGRSLGEVEAIIAAATIQKGNTGKSHGTKWSQVAQVSGEVSSRMREAGASKRKSTSGKLLSLSAVRGRLCLGKARLCKAVALGRVTPAFTTDTGLILFRPTQLRAIARKLNSTIRII